LVLSFVGGHIYFHINTRKAVNCTFLMNVELKKVMNFAVFGIHGG